MSDLLDREMTPRNFLAAILWPGGPMPRISIALHMVLASYLLDEGYLVTNSEDWYVTDKGRAWLAVPSDTTDWTAYPPASAFPKSAWLQTPKGMAYADSGSHSRKDGFEKGQTITDGKPQYGPPRQKPTLGYIHPEDWRTLQRIQDGSQIVERETPNLGMAKSFTVGKGRVNWSSEILDNLAAWGYLDRSTNKVTPAGAVALIYRNMQRGR